MNSLSFGEAASLCVASFAGAGPTKVLLVCANSSDLPLFKDWIHGVDCEESLGEEDRQRSIPFIRGDGDTLHLGSWHPDQPRCPECLRLRAIVRRHPIELAAHFNRSGKTPSSQPWLTPFALELVSSLVLSPERNAGSDHFGYAIHLPSLRVRSFALVAHSGCSVCGKEVSDSASAATVRLTERKKKGALCYRDFDATQLQIPQQLYLDPLGGILGRSYAENREDDFSAPVTGSFWELSRRSSPSFWSGRTTCYRKSLMVGMLEGFERHAGLAMRGKRCAVFDSLSNLGNDALDPRECGLYEQVPVGSRLESFTEKMKLHWVWGYSLTQSRPLLIPAQLAFYGGQIDGEATFVRESSNGCASGASLEEAVFYALLELIERDAFLIHWYARLTPPQIDLATIQDPKINMLLERFRCHNLEISILDTRLDIGVPSVAAIAMRRDGQLGVFSLALGCNFDPHQAMASALFEVASHQVGFRMRAEASRDKLYGTLKDFSKVQTMADHAALYALPEAVTHARFLIESTSRSSAEIAYSSWLKNVSISNDLLEDVQSCIGLLASAGLGQVIVIDQTSPEQRNLGLFTVRAMVPGMLPMDFGHGFCRSAALKRLYSVPVRLGLRASIGVNELNRVPHPFA